MRLMKGRQLTHLLTCVSIERYTVGKLWLCALRFPQGKVPCWILWDTTRARFFSLVGFFENRKSLTEIPRNACGMDRASAVTWHNPIPADGRLDELACTGASEASLQEHFGGDWVLPRYSPSRLAPLDFPQGHVCPCGKLQLRKF